MSVKSIWHKVKAIPLIGNTYEKYALYFRHGIFRA